ncbi:MAG: hypothetical protein HN350_03465 [Phycisphaerales bacterium]|jgi:hypothetical protein|nr:hypothetical protein [Phycisphaerales bacterium]
MKRAFAYIVCGLLVGWAGLSRAAEPFGIRVVDSASQRGVPLVELETVNGMRFVTDSAGRIAFAEPGLMNSKVFFTIRSHGYTFPKDGFGFAGKALQISPGGSVILKIKRVNIAERLCRLTGGGIYRDTVLLGKKAPLARPLLNGRVFGQDSAQAAIYRRKAYWFWGDTQRPGYPLGHFQTSGATVELLATGRLDQSRAIEYKYFTSPSGFSRKVCPLAETPATMVWIDGLAVVADASGAERLTTRYSQMKSLGKMLGQGLAVWNDKKAVFEPAGKFALDEKWRIPQGHAIKFSEGKRKWIVFANPWPVVRAAATLAALGDSKQYEAFTCLKPGSRYAKGKSQIHRDASGKIIWAWKRNTDPITQPQEKQMISAGLLTGAEARFQLRDASGAEVRMHRGSVRWNAYLKQWVLIGVQSGGASSYLGEIWIACSASLGGPWRSAVKIVTHDKYSFYNPVHHAFMDSKDGRYIHFEGTYSDTFSKTPAPTPRYNYNQILYRLDLSDPRLKPAN